MFVYFIVIGIYSYLEKRNEAEQAPVSPLATNAEKDTRRIPQPYGNDYEKYLKEGFPSPQLEVNERTELNDERLREEDTLSTYDYVDKNAGTVRIPIDRAMDLMVQRRLAGAHGSQRYRSRAGAAVAAPEEGKQKVSSRNHNSVCVRADALVRPVEHSSTAHAPDAAGPRSLRILLSLALLASTAFGQAMTKGIMSPPANVRPLYLQNVGIEQHLDAQVPADLAFTDDTGRPVKLGDYFGKKPLILNLVYYNCTMLCGEALAGLSGSMKMIKFERGRRIRSRHGQLQSQGDARHSPPPRKRTYLKRYGRPGAAAGWHFLTGPPASINALTKAVGFQYQYDEAHNQYAHATAIMVLTPQGRISRYFYGVDFPPKDLRMGLVEASQGKIGNAVDAVLLYCYHYDPATGKYGAVITNILRLGAGFTILILGVLLFILIRMDKSATRRIAGKARLSQTRYVR